MTQTDATRALAILSQPATAITDANLGIVPGLARLNFFEKITIGSDLHWFGRGAVVMPIESLIALKDLLVQECAKIEVSHVKQ